MRERTPQPRRRGVHEERRRECERHGDDERKARRHERADDRARRAERAACGVPVVGEEEAQALRPPEIRRRPHERGGQGDCKEKPQRRT